ncbi:MAG: trypsin-like peptidase domain-containing protein [Xanthobacteraceae bacterium]
MSDVGAAHIIIRHISGSKANQVEQILLKDLREITIGRDPSSTINFDQRRDDVVSRRHALVRVEGGGNPVFRLRDLGSSNGTFLNGEPVESEVELSPEDIIELGKDGAKFSFDVQPRPASWASRTRVIDAMDTTVTRAIASVAADSTATHEAVAYQGTKDFDSVVPADPPKAGVGKETVLRMLTQQRKSTSRVWMGSLAAVIAVFAVVGYWFYRHTLSVAATEVAQQTQAVQKSDNQMVAEKFNSLGLAPKQVYDKYGNTVVYIRVQWRLFDLATGKPVFQKVVKTRDGLFPAFVKVNDTIYRWLTLQDDNRTNLPIQEEGSGSGFVAGEHGFILTNKHVAAGWLTPFRDLGDDARGYTKAAIYTYGSKKRVVQVGESLNDDIFAHLRNWIPASGAPVFSDDNATYLGGENDTKHTFSGRDEILEVRFPRDRLGIEAQLVRASTDADVALVKIDTAQDLKTVELGKSDPVQVGDRVMALGYPAVSAQTKINMETIQGGQVEKVDEEIPEPTMTEGIVQRLGTYLHEAGEATIYGTAGDAIQLSINATGEGNSGGPVFNDKGRIIGIFTYYRMVNGARVSFAVPISHAIDLLEPQQAGAN